MSARKTFLILLVLKSKNSSFTHNFQSQLILWNLRFCSCYYYPSITYILCQQETTNKPKTSDLINNAFCQRLLFLFLIPTSFQAERVSLLRRFIPLLSSSLLDHQPSWSGSLLPVEASPRRLDLDLYSPRQSPLSLSACCHVSPLCVMLRCLVCVGVARHPFRSLWLTGHVTQVLPIIHQHLPNILLDPHSSLLFYSAVFLWSKFVYILIFCWPVHVYLSWETVFRSSVALCEIFYFFIYY